jgi:hypothetical protein
MLILSACSPQVEDESWIVYETEGLGIAVELPESWVIEEDQYLLSLANDSDHIISKSFENGAGGTITPTTTFNFSNVEEPVEILERLKGYFNGEENSLNVIVEPTMLTIQGQSAATMTYDGTLQGQDGRFTTTVIVNDENVAVVFTIDGSEDNQYSEMLERITSSVIVSVPSIPIY